MRNRELEGRIVHHPEAHAVAHPEFRAGRSQERSRQQQRHCNYIVSGSAVSLLRQITEDASAPFFQHFTAMHLGPLREQDAVGLLVDFSRRSGVAIPDELARRMTKLVGTNPYYLQVHRRVIELWA